MRYRFDLWLRKIPGEENATHSRILAWEIPWARSLAEYSPRCHRRAKHGSVINRQQWPLWAQPPTPAPPPLPLGNHRSTLLVRPCLFHRCVHLRHILDSAYPWSQIVSVFLFLTHFTKYDNLSVHPCCKCHYPILSHGWVTPITRVHRQIDR